MKKAYQNPAMTVVNIQGERLVCQSPEFKTNSGMKMKGAGGGREARGRESVETDWEEEW